MINFHEAYLREIQKRRNDVPMTIRFTKYNPEDNQYVMVEKQIVEYIVGWHKEDWCHVVSIYSERISDIKRCRLRESNTEHIEITGAYRAEIIWYENYDQHSPVNKVFKIKEYSFKEYDTDERTGYWHRFVLDDGKVMYAEPESIGKIKIT